MELNRRGRLSRSRGHHSSRPFPVAPPRAVPARGPSTPRDAIDPLQTALPDDAPLLVRYADENGHAYLVHDLLSHEWVSVPKARRASTDLREPRGQRGPGSRLLRWSVIALLGVALGGAGGVVLGLPVAFLAWAQLWAHARRVRRWRRSQIRHGEVPLLPAAASAERARLRTALWQGGMAVLLGSVLLLLLSGHLL